MTTKITNPILRGFNPDPSIIRVEDEYFLVTSTFEWFPGVQVHTSRDLAHWRTTGQILDRSAQLDMKGIPDSCGVWAPCLSYDKGTFYLVYSNVRSFDGPWKDTPNYLVTSHSINGPWSDPIYLNSNGFDGSLFHDKDGKKWLVNMLVDHRGGKFFGGIQLQEWNEKSGELVGETHHIFNGTELGCTEGPHLYCRNGWYYLVLAEGGTEYNHAVTVARAKNITGPYELHPHNPIVKASPNAFFQRTGHADFVETQSGEWYIVYLGSRPLMPAKRCTLGRETLIEQLFWEDDWPYLANADKNTRQTIPAPDLVLHPYPAIATKDNFNTSKLAPCWQSLRIPADETWMSLAERPGYLRLKGRESPSSTHEQSLIARRLQSFDVIAACQMEFAPTSFQQMAGIICYYNTNHYIYFHATSDEADSTLNQLHLIEVINGVLFEPMPEKISYPKTQPVYLQLTWQRDELQFYYSLTNEPESWIKCGPLRDGSVLSDDFVRDGGHKYRAAFTGAFIGLCCQDFTGRKTHADFDWFSYEDLSQ